MADDFETHTVRIAKEGRIVLGVVFQVVFRWRGSCLTIDELAVAHVDVCVGLGLETQMVQAGSVWIMRYVGFRRANG